MSSGSSDKLTLPEAQEGFLNIVRKLNDSDNFKQLLNWIQWNWLNDGKLKESDTSEEILDSIAADLRSSLPLEAVLPSEIIRAPTFGKNSDCEQQHTVHVDAFLYDDEMVDVLCDEGKIPRSCCLQCGSLNTRPLTFISHSLSRERLLFIFKSMLPPLDGKVVLDVGSRLGAALYGACVYSKASKIVGVEINADFCNIQKKIIEKYNFQDRIEIIEANIAHRPDIILAVDVVIMNNVFEFFVEPEQQISIWKFLRQTTKSGTLLVTVPPLEETFSYLQTGIVLSEWVQELPLYNPDAAGITMSAEEMQELKHYRVI
ncbi:uncharacterized protein LOC110837842 [Zootermopsis nevadensis]|uniref:Methyltransferase type 11 domain-containing protein n=1 Tax=Zootermopsis nevadensis TaxID=136037 RepID=A0A067QPX7_ZOONE|nr:uncharacterized protein LOC110837842 [Zootermopsis nevadensis]XP_021936103.1 uncharacterized protein LOC110837842 [Zootermopsis nevadensis]XP_021936104.1 uncharacterized protein LOC110837842 [Zootermopsis nevadensis]KDR10605.1 hypothetical protein L798_15132 [Zootermopsis nevadensis]